MLTRLRSRIRWFVFLEGIAVAISALLLTFWISLAIDYLPVRFGLPELSRPVRIGLLVLVFSLVAFVLYRLVIRRVFVRLKDSSLALLVERKYPEFCDSLLTTVNQVGKPTDNVAVDQEMLEGTRLQAESLVRNVELNSIINSRPLKRSLICAGLLLASVVIFAIAQPETLKLAGKRLYLLENKLWPRRCTIELVGIKINRENPVEGIDELGQTLLPKNDEFRIAKGSTLTLMVRADETQRLPTNCSLIYETKDGNGVQNFKRIGVPRNGFQLYSLDGQPFRGILKEIKFYVRGGDHRIGPYKIAIVDPPNVESTELAVRYPKYILDEDSGRFTDRTLAWSGQAQVPEGTGVTILSKSNNNLKKVYALDRTNNKMEIIEASGNEFEFELPGIRDAVNVQFYLCDQDNLVSEQPHTVSIEPIKDEPPVVQTGLTGIGTAVTPDVQIPFSGSVTDDHGLQKTWVEIEVAEADTIEEPIRIGDEGELDTLIDFKQRRQDIGPQYELPTAEGSTLQFVIRSEDRFDLDQSPNIGVGDRYTLDIVTPNELVRILERLEVAQRRRLEQIYLELADARNYLVRTKSSRASSMTSDPGLIEPGDGDDLSEPGESDAQPEIRKQELRLLFAQRAILQTDKSIQEILGSANAFDNIRLQLINNRIDSEDRKKRFSEQIIAPLRLIGRESMQQLKEGIIELEVNLRDLHLNPEEDSILQSADLLAENSIENVDKVLAQLDEVLNVLIKYETQNELLEIVRQMIKQQQALKDRTKKERQRKAFDGLLD